MESSFTLLRVRGIAIGAHWSWLIVFAIVVWSLGTVLFPATYPELDGSTHLVMAMVAAIVLFTSVLLHELGHALRALSEGLPIKGITLWLFGGVAHLGGTPPSPGAEFRVAACGPAVSAALAAGFYVAAWIGDSMGWPGAIQGTVDYLGRINLLLLAFNLVPALPLDGGRVLRAWLWHRQRSFTAATRSAAAVGKVFGFVLVAVGLLGIWTGGGTGGIWLAFLGWFLVRAASSEATQAILRRALDGVRVGDVMDPSPAGNPAPLPKAGAISPDRPLTDVLDLLVESGGTATVVDDGRQVGILRAGDVAQVVEARERLPEDPAPRSAGVLVWLLVGAIIAGAAAAVYHPPYVVIAPGAAIEISDDIAISGTPVDDLRGRYLMATVGLSRPSALGALWASLRSDREVIAVSKLTPPGVSVDRYAEMQQRVFVESRQLAAAAAARAVGLPVTLTGTGARVLAVADDSPAEGKLEKGDVITSVDGRAVETTADLVTAIRSRPAGSELAIVLQRSGGRLTVSVASEKLPDLAGGVGIGVVVETRNLDIDLPFEVTFTERNVGGPSAGLAYALAIADLLDERDFAMDRTVAATGTIDLDGDVGLVGGVPQKAIAVEDSGADLFLVPQQEVDQANREGLAVRGVDELGEALALLAGG